MAVMVLCVLACSYIADRFEQARRQSEAVAAFGGREFVVYDYEMDRSGNMLHFPEPTTPKWLLDRYGVDFFHPVVIVHVTKPESLGQVGKLRHLQELYVSCATTDADLVHLKGLRQLQRLDLCHSQISEEGANTLQAALPKCQIDW